MVGQKYRTWHRWRFKYSNTQKHVPKQNTLISIIGFQECLSLASRTVLWDCANGIFSFSHFLSRNSLEFHWKGTEIKKFLPVLCAIYSHLSGDTWCEPNHSWHPLPIACDCGDSSQGVSYISAATLTSQLSNFSLVWSVNSWKTFLLLALPL